MKDKIIYRALLIVVLFFISSIVADPCLQARAKKKPVYVFHKHYKKYIPSNYPIDGPQRVRFNGSEIIIDLYASSFSQGNVIYLEILKAGDSKNKDLKVLACTFDGKPITCARYSWGYRSLFALPATMAPGKKIFSLRYSMGDAVVDISHQVEIQSSPFPFSKQALDLGDYSNIDYKETPEIIAFIIKCAAKKKEVFSRLSNDRISSTLAHPRDGHFITSPFWASRLIMKYRVKDGIKIPMGDSVNVHAGIDLRGGAGEPVYAIADGIVAIAEPMHYEGNFIVIDHGNKIFSYYMHLKSFNVKEGDTVAAGKKIGEVGSTGLSTGAHLHVSLIIHGDHVNPLSVLALPVRN